jgi:hypothetical protein
LKDCPCLEEEETETTTIVCKRLGDDPDAWLKKAAKAFAQLPDFTSDSWADNRDSVGQPDSEPEVEICEDDDICCELFGPDPDATIRRAAESIAQCRNITSDSFADTEFTSMNQPWIDLDDGIWADLQDNIGQSDE